MVGNGGWAGTISLAQMDAAVRDGYAATSTDTGHDAQKEPGATFAYPGPNNPNATRKVIDHGYLAVHETAVLAKKVIRAYYGADPRYSYWVGCSTGGREGLMERNATRRISTATWLADRKSTRLNSSHLGIS